VGMASKKAAISNFFIVIFLLTLLLYKIVIY